MSEQLSKISPATSNEQSTNKEQNKPGKSTSLGKGFYLEEPTTQAKTATKDKREVRRPPFRRGRSDADSSLLT